MLQRLAALALLVPVVSAQDPCEGNGLGVTIAISPAYLGESLTVALGSPQSPGGFGLLAFSGAVGPIDHPLLGPSCLDVFVASFQTWPLALDAAGEAHLTAMMPADPALLGAPPVFLSAAAIVGSSIGLSKTVPVWFAQHDSWSPAGKLTGPRGFLRATALGDGPTADRIGVFVSGGGDQSLVYPGSKDDTWLFRPFDRTFVAGPTMSVPRNFHTQTRLADGRILIAGGCDASGVVHASAEIYDHSSGTLVPVASMNAKRSGHAATLLPDGRVFVSGGLADFQNAATAFAAAMDTVQNTAELYDPVLDTWSPTNAMGWPRAGHGQILWPDGRVMIVSGVNGGVVTPSYETASFINQAEWFDPVTESYTFTPYLAHGGRANFGMSFDASGSLVVGGGASTEGGCCLGASIAEDRVEVFDGSAWATSSVFLPTGAAFVSQATLPDGRAVIVGGFTGNMDVLAATAQVAAIDGSVAKPLAPIGTSPSTPGASSPRGGHAMVELFDGTLLVVGGMNGSSATPVGTWALDDAWIYAP